MATDNHSSKGDYHEPDYAKPQDKSKPPYYHPNIEHKIPAETHELLEKYSHIPREQHSEHVHKTRDQAWEIRSYPCIGLGSWLVPQLRRQPVYNEILQRVKAGGSVLDVGTFIGYDLRALAYDGAPSDQLYGLDIVNHFDVGYDFFRDHGSFKGRFIEADMLSPDAPELQPLRKSVDIVIVSQVLHQWNWANQVRGAQALTTFTKPGSMIVGNQIGNVKAQEIAALGNNLPDVYRHDPESFARLWDEVGKAVGMRFETQGRLRSFVEMGWDPNDAAWMDKGTRVLEFVIRRLE